MNKLFDVLKYLGYDNEETMELCSSIRVGHRLIIEGNMSLEQRKKVDELRLYGFDVEFLQEEVRIIQRQNIL